MQRIRILTIALLLPIGVASKWYSGPGARFVVGHVWDALGSAVVLLLARLLIPRARLVRTATVVGALLAGNELLQLLHAPWLEDLRATAPGRVVLGSGWSVTDLVLIVAAVAITAAADARLTPPSG